ncbi:patatin-like phospholipase family protein [Bradyrhizobium sp.]
MFETFVRLLAHTPSDLLRLLSLTKAQILVVTLFCAITQASNQLPELIIGYAQLPPSLFVVRETVCVSFIFSMLLGAYCFENIVMAEAGHPYDRLWSRRFLISCYTLLVAVSPLAIILVSIKLARQGFPIGSASDPTYLLEEVERWFRWEILFVSVLTFVFSYAALEKDSFVRRETVLGRQLVLFLVSPVFAVITWISIWISLTGSPPELNSLEGGTVLFVLVFFVVLTIIASCLSSVFNYISGPVLAAVFAVYYLCLSVYGLNDHHLITGSRLSLSLPESSEKFSDQPSLDMHFSAWNAKRDNKSQPIFIIAAQGGGIYAAYHTASTIAKLIGPEYNLEGDIFAISSVSGGSVGAAVALAVIDAVKRRAVQTKVGEDNPCETVRYVYEMTQQAIDRIFETDYVYPLLMGGLFIDSVLEFMPSALFSNYFNKYDRSFLLERALVTRTQQVLIELLGEAPSPNLLDRAMSDLDPIFNPELYVNVVATNNGDRNYLGRFRLEEFKVRSEDPDALEKRILNRALTDLDLPLIIAAVLSARFPYVTPPASINDRKGDVRRFVDGGYFENSGVATALDIARQIDGKASGPVKLIVLGNRGSQKIENSYFNEIMTPIRAMLQTRVARGEDYVDEAASVFGSDVLQVRASELEAPLTLGWFLSKGKLGSIQSTISDELRKKRSLVRSTCAVEHSR